MKEVSKKGMEKDRDRARKCINAKCNAPNGQASCLHGSSLSSWCECVCVKGKKQTNKQTKKNLVKHFE